MKWQGVKTRNGDPLRPVSSRAEAGAEGLK
jgi:hypothetical protein